ncbi:MAG TPA: TolC family protein [Gemmatimonadales bacterium]|nr:TolC family protein [Gemmatimonadales bacterium]
MIRVLPAALASLVGLGRVVLAQESGQMAPARDTLGLAAVQEAALRSDPRGRQRELLRAANDLRLSVIGADRLPQLSLNGQASHQSDVTRPAVGVPGLDIPELPKDRWQTTLEVQQRLYDGGEVARRRAVERARHAEAQAALDVSLYELRLEVNAAFYTAFLLDRQAREFDALVTDLEARLAAARARVEAGTALGRDAAEIEAERVRAGLRRDEARASRRAALAILGDLIGAPVDTAAVLVLPTGEPERSQRADPAALATLRQRPEFEQLRRSRLRLEREVEATAAENRPRLFAFGQAGVGLPGLDQFRRSSDAFWQAGVRLEWRPWTWRSAGRRAAAFRLEQEVLETEEAALGRRLARAVASDLEDIARLEAALADDRRIVELRTEVERQARAQYDEGVITTPEYVEVRTDVLEARLELERHRVELAQARSRYLTTLGIAPSATDDTP